MRVLLTAVRVPLTCPADRSVLVLGSHYAPAAVAVAAAVVTLGEGG